MKINELLSLINEDYQRYLKLENKEFEWGKFVARIFFYNILVLHMFIFK